MNIERLYNFIDKKVDYFLKPGGGVMRTHTQKKEQGKFLLQ